MKEVEEMSQNLEDALWLEIELMNPYEIASLNQRVHQFLMERKKELLEVGAA